MATAESATAVNTAPQFPVPSGPGVLSSQPDPGVAEATATGAAAVQTQVAGATTTAAAASETTAAPSQQSSLFFTGPSNTPPPESGRGHTTDVYYFIFLGVLVALVLVAVFLTMRSYRLRRRYRTHAQLALMRGDPIPDWLRASGPADPNGAWPTGFAGGAGLRGGERDLWNDGVYTGGGAPGPPERWAAVGGSRGGYRRERRWVRIPLLWEAEAYQEDIDTKGKASDSKRVDGESDDDDGWMELGQPVAIQSLLPAPPFKPAPYSPPVVESQRGRLGAFFRATSAANLSDAFSRGDTQTPGSGDATTTPMGERGERATSSPSSWTRRPGRSRAPPPWDRVGAVGRGATGLTGAAGMPRPPRAGETGEPESEVDRAAMGLTSGEPVRIAVIVQMPCAPSTSRPGSGFVQMDEDEDEEVGWEEGMELGVWEGYVGGLEEWQGEETFVSATGTPSGTLTPGGIASDAGPSADEATHTRSASSTGWYDRSRTQTEKD